MKNNIFLSAIFAALFTFMFCQSGFTQTQTADYYNVNAGIGKGLRLWNGNNSYKIHMGNSSVYKYGPVTDYSIKTNMSNTASRGWTWGAYNTTPVAALNTQGKFQTAGWIKTMNRSYYFGDAQRLYGDNSSALYWTNNHSTITQLIMRDKENTIYGRLYGSGNGANFGLLDGDGNWSYLAAKDNYTSFLINNSEKMRIKSNGNIGIGTSNPQKKLVVRGATELGGTTTARSLGIQSYSSALTGVPGSTFGVQVTGPLHSHLVFDIHANDGNDGFYIRVPSTLGTNPTVNTTAFAVKGNGKTVIGNVGFSSNNYKLFVEKGILAEKVKVAVKNTADWSDYVFEEDYEVMPIAELEDYVAENKHLPNVPSAKEMVKNGLDVATMDAKLLEKIEELHLYIIELHKGMEGLKAQMNDKQ